MIDETFLRYAMFQCQVKSIKKFFSNDTDRYPLPNILQSREPRLNLMHMRVICIVS